jgi:hypothetical protein
MSGLAQAPRKEVMRRLRCETQAWRDPSAAACPRQSSRAGDVLTERTVGSTEKSPGSHVTLARDSIGTHLGTGNRREEGTLDGEHGGTVVLRRKVTSGNSTDSCTIDSSVGSPSASSERARERERRAANRDRRRQK